MEELILTREDNQKYFKETGKFKAGFYRVDPPLEEFDDEVYINFAFLRNGEYIWFNTDYYPSTLDGRKPWDRFNRDTHESYIPTPMIADVI